MSVATETGNVTTAPSGPSASNTNSTGKVNVGATVSTTRMVNSPDATAPVESVAVAVTVVEPSANTLSEAALVTGVNSVPATSVAETAKFTAAPAGLVASTLIG